SRMNLSDRLAAAARVRGEEPEMHAATTVGGRLAQGATALASIEISIMLPPDGPVSMIARDPDATPGSLCPTCTRPGELGLVDLHRHPTDYQCTTCGTMWRALDTTPPPPAVPASGQRLMPPMRG